MIVNIHHGWLEEWAAGCVCWGERKNLGRERGFYWGVRERGKEGWCGEEEGALGRWAENMGLVQIEKVLLTLGQVQHVT